MSDTSSNAVEPESGAHPTTERAHADTVDPTSALSVIGLRKAFGQMIAVDGIDLDVPSGSFYGLVGPNGAGTTTTLSMATGLLRPDAGTARVHGVDVWTQPLEAKRLIGSAAGAKHPRVGELPRPIAPIRGSFADQGICR